MNRSDESAPAPRSCCVAEERLEAYTAGELSPHELEAIETQLADCDDCVEAVRLAAVAKHALGQLPELRCPTRLVEAAAAAAAVQPASKESFAGVSKRGVALLAVAASIAAVWFTAPKTPQPTEPVITTRLDAEEAKLVLAELRETFRSRAESVKQKVYDQSVAKPARTVLYAVTDSGLGDWGSKSASLLGGSEPSPPDAS